MAAAVMVVAMAAAVVAAIAADASFPSRTPIIQISFLRFLTPLAQSSGVVRSRGAPM
jgi:hypothetical protein